MTFFSICPFLLSYRLPSFNLHQAVLFSSKTMWKWLFCFHLTLKLDEFQNEISVESMGLKFSFPNALFLSLSLSKNKNLKKSILINTVIGKSKKMLFALLLKFYFLVAIHRGKKFRIKHCLVNWFIHSFKIFWGILYACVW